MKIVKEKVKLFLSVDTIYAENPKKSKKVEKIGELIKFAKYKILLAKPT